MVDSKKPDLLKLPRWNQLPSVDQYLEQVLQLIDKWLGDYLPHSGKQLITRTMVNNYVKQRYIDSPENKKYNRLTIARLFVITLLKPVYTIDEISRLIQRGIDFKDAEFSYNQFCDMVETAVKHAFEGTTMPKSREITDPNDMFWHVCNSFASQLYVRHEYLI
ncbi:MAG: DUF1836 domain-containing protein [Firmicutes bacterium]|nr:DUF1836 domain-containing protein [Bacillota bacterium]